MDIGHLANPFLDEYGRGDPSQAQTPETGSAASSAREDGKRPRRSLAARPPAGEFDPLTARPAQTYGSIGARCDARYDRALPADPD